MLSYKSPSFTLDSSHHRLVKPHIRNNASILPGHFAQRCLLRRITASWRWTYPHQTLCKV